MRTERSIKHFWSVWHTLHPAVPQVLVISCPSYVEVRAWSYQILKYQKYPLIAR